MSIPKASYEAKAGSTWKARLPKGETVAGLPRSGTRSVVGRRRAKTKGTHESAPALPVLHVKQLLFLSYQFSAYLYLRSFFLYLRQNIIEQSSSKRSPDCFKSV